MFRKAESENQMRVALGRSFGGILEGRLRRRESLRGKFPLTVNERVTEVINAFIIYDDSFQSRSFYNSFALSVQFGVSGSSEPAYLPHLLDLINCDGVNFQNWKSAR